MQFFKAVPNSMLYNSKSFSYKVLDALRGIYRWNKGERIIGKGFQESLDISVFHRLMAEHVESVGFLDSGKRDLRYRPHNVKIFLEQALNRNDDSLDEMLTSINEEAKSRQNPPIEGLNRHFVTKLLANW
jgi:hypothetical protein